MSRCAPLCRERRPSIVLVFQVEVLGQWDALRVHVHWIRMVAGRPGVNALTLLLPPQGIWSIDEAIAADGIVPGGPRFEAARFDALERYAHGCVSNENIERLRDAAERIEMQLPIVGLPRASATLAAACAVIATDEGWCAAIAARQLALYASDPGIAVDARASRLSM